MRPLALSDLEAHYAVVDSDPQVTWLGQARTYPEAEKYITKHVHLWQERGFGVYAVIERASGAFLGHAGLEPLEDSDEIQLSYYLGQPAWGKGFATEAGEAVLKHGFEDLGLEHIVAVVRPHNLGSRRVLSKLGFIHQRDGIFYEAEAQYWSISRARWLELSRGPDTSSA